MSRKTAIVITGPTASGKSALAVEIAEHLNTEIISADSRQIYQGIPIVTAMPDDDQRTRVPHHLIDCLPLDAYYSAASFEEDALRLLQQKFETHNEVVICGGSMMYIDALCNGIDNIPTVPDEIRQALKLEHQANGDDWLLEQLDLCDPQYAARVDRKNMKRVFHAVEVYRTAGVPYSSFLTGSKVPRPFDIRKVCVSMDRSELFDRINRRVVQMVDQGLEDEARSVYHLRHLNSLNTVGLKEMFAMFEGTYTLDEAIAKIQKNTRVYAKKQMFWHQKDPDIEFMTPQQVLKSFK